MATKQIRRENFLCRAPFQLSLSSFEPPLLGICRARRPWALVGCAAMAGLWVLQRRAMASPSPQTSSHPSPSTAQPAAAGGNFQPGAVSSNQARRCPSWEPSLACDAGGPRISWPSLSCQCFSRKVVALKSADILLRAQDQRGQSHHVPCCCQLHDHLDVITESPGNMPLCSLQYLMRFEMQQEGELFKSVLKIIGNTSSILG